MSRLTNLHRTNFKTKEFGNQLYRSSLDFGAQMRVATEKAKSQLTDIKESEMVRPYDADSYEEMEYNLVPEAGMTTTPPEDAHYDVPWNDPPYVDDTFEDYWNPSEDEEVTSETITATYVAASNMFARRYWDWSSSNECKEIVSDSTLYVTNQDYSLSSETHCGLLFDGATQLWRRFATLFSGVVTHGAAFETVYLRLTTTGSWNDRTVNWNFYGNDVASAVIPSSFADYDSKALTTAKVATVWSGVQGVTPTVIDYDVTAPVNEIIARGDWASENSLQILVKNIVVGSGVGNIIFSGIDAALALRPRLITIFKG